jgi:hypothetical protein
MSLLSGERGQGDLLPFLFPPEDGDTPILWTCGYISTREYGQCPKFQSCLLQHSIIKSLWFEFKCGLLLLHMVLLVMSIL